MDGLTDMTCWLQIAQWYSETLSLLPTYLLRYDMNSDTGHPLVTVLHAWKNATDHHQKHHPIPHKNQLETLRDTVRLIADMTVRKQIRLLLYRYTLLCHLIPSITRKLFLQDPRLLYCFYVYQSTLLTNKDNMQTNTNMTISTQLKNYI